MIFPDWVRNFEHLTIVQKAELALVDDWFFLHTYKWAKYIGRNPYQSLDFTRQRQMLLEDANKLIWC